MLVLLDIGNTAVTFGIYNHGRFSSSGSFNNNDIPKNLKKMTKYGGDCALDVVISSVVPKITSKIKKMLSGKRGVKIWEVGKNIPVKIDHKYLEINKLGSDRKVNIYGATRIYKPPLLVVDFGTAITMDYISSKGVFEGGLIVPGPQIALETLAERAALLPKKIRLPDKPIPFLGRTPKQCMVSGILQGYGAMVDGLIRRFRDQFGYKFRVVVTGGYSEVLKPYTHSFQIMDPKLSIKSLLILYKEKS